MDFITGGPLVALVLEGHEAVKAARQVIGATNPLEAAPGSIRGDFGLEVQTNLVHGSDSPESAAREIGLFFPELDLSAHPRLRLAAAAGDPRAARAWILRRGPDVKELTEGARATLVVENALLQARAVPGERVLGADTRGRAGRPRLGKPADEAEAERWLRELSGRGHEVWAGSRCARAARSGPASAVTRVRFRELERGDIDWYLAAASGAIAPAATRSRARRHAGRGKSRATSSTWWACRCPPCCG